MSENILKDRSGSIPVLVGKNIAEDVVLHINDKIFCQCSEMQLTLLSIVIIKMEEKVMFNKWVYSPEENILTKEIESWEGFADSLKSEDRRLP
jgi:hypothetical protein